MNSEQLQRLQDEMNQELQEILNDSKFAELLEKYELLGDKVLKFQCVLDLTKLKSHDVNNNEETKEFLQAQHEQEIVLATKSWCVPCPTFGFPMGCYC
ncbi:hypothetical protein NIES4071_15890 [Calothrix sp. NIES-4071]|nr:hypothetical protein NIES4071_15890 [Calothrix sp. NIES-4071]BAZ55926.1 hypothetical protein NIES4105_15840 [Calothrix sp. NIES-4105]